MRYIPFIITLCFILRPNILLSRQVQWASHVLGVSSEREQDPVGEGYRAFQALGEPENWPALALSPCAWSPSQPDGREDEWIHLGFSNPQTVHQLFIVENAGAGSITQVFLYDTGGEAHLVYEDFVNQPPDSPRRLFTIELPSKTSYRVQSVKVVMSTLDIQGWNQIDALGISPSAGELSLPIESAAPDVASAPEILPNSINSRYQEVLPLALPDRSGIFFVRKNHPDNFDGRAKVNDDIWYAALDEENRWGDIYRMPAPINNRDHNFVGSITPDGNTIILGNTYGMSESGGTYQSGLSYSQRIAKGWSSPKPLNIQNHYNWSKTSEFCMSASEQVIIFAVQRRDSEGEKDLYVSFFSEEDNHWSEPMHTGGLINTPADEAAPFLAADGKTLYFASKGLRGYGDFDLYVTKRLDDTWSNWSKPKNLGPVFNSSASDVSFSIDAFGEYAYFASARYDRNGSNDLFRIPLPKSLKPEPIVIVEGTVYNQADGQPIGANIRYSQLSTGHALGTANSDPNTGSYRIALPFRNNYSFFATSPNFLSVEDHLDLDGETSEETYKIVRDLYLVPLEEGRVLRLNNVFFARSSADLLDTSNPELKRLASTLLAHPNLKVALEGHTDIEGVPSENMKLSKQRVEAVEAFLIEQGVPQEQLETKAYGSTQPLSRSRTPKAKNNNRRVEVRILEVGE